MSEENKKEEVYTVGRGIRKAAEAFALACLIAACTYMEVSPAVEGGAGKLWVMVVAWCILF